MRALPPTPSLERRVKVITPKVELVIACEGKNTEPDYINACIDEYSAGLVRLRLLKVGGVPMTLVDAAIEERSRLIEKYRRSPDSFDCCFKVWAVFDRDEHPKVDEAIALAKQNGIEVAFSDPCFEVWPLLHLLDYGGQDGRHQVQKRLRDLMPGYDHEKEARVDYQKISGQISTALTRASTLNKARIKEGCENGCPSTTVGTLVEKIFQNGKRRPVAAVPVTSRGAK